MKQIAINKKVLIKSPTFITWTLAGDVLLMNRSWTKYLLRLSKYYFPKTNTSELNYGHIIYYSASVQ